jgi:hypothetical protein
MPERRRPHAFRIKRSEATAGRRTTGNLPPSPREGLCLTRTFSAKAMSFTTIKVDTGKGLPRVQRSGRTFQKSSRYWGRIAGELEAVGRTHQVIRSSLNGPGLMRLASSSPNMSIEVSPSA